MYSSQPKKLTTDEALIKAQKYCAYQERCFFDAKRKLYSWGLTDEQIVEVLNQLEKDNFLSDARFAELYVRSKVNQKKWGKLKIIAELNSKNISSSIIDEQIAKINTEVYLGNIRQLIENKMKEIEGLETINQLQKLNRYLQSKGYESEIIIKTLKPFF